MIHQSKESEINDLVISFNSKIHVVILLYMHLQLLLLAYYNDALILLNNYIENVHIRYKCHLQQSY